MPTATIPNNYILVRPPHNINPSPSPFYLAKNLKYRNATDKWARYGTYGNKIRSNYSHLHRAPLFEIEELAAINPILTPATDNQDNQIWLVNASTDKIPDWSIDGKRVYSEIPEDFLRENIATTTLPILDIPYVSSDHTYLRGYQQRVAHGSSQGYHSSLMNGTIVTDLHEAFLTELKAQRGTTTVLIISNPTTSPTLEKKLVKNNMLGKPRQFIPFLSRHKKWNVRTGEIEDCYMLRLGTVTSFSYFFSNAKIRTWFFPFLRQTLLRLTVLPTNIKREKTFKKSWEGLEEALVEFANDDTDLPALPDKSSIDRTFVKETQLESLKFSLEEYATYLQIEEQKKKVDETLRNYKTLKSDAEYFIRGRKDTIVRYQREIDNYQNYITTEKNSIAEREGQLKQLEEDYQVYSDPTKIARLAQAKAHAERQFKEAYEKARESFQYNEEADFVLNLEKQGVIIDSMNWWTEGFGDSATRKNEKSLLKEVCFHTTKPMKIVIDGNTENYRIGGPWNVKATLRTGYAVGTLNPGIGVRLASLNSIFAIQNRLWKPHPHTPWRNFPATAEHFRNELNILSGGCLGELSPLLISAAQNNDLQLVVISCLTWLGSANTINDHWGKDVRYFPREDEIRDYVAPKSPETAEDVPKILITAGKVYEPVAPVVVVAAPTAPVPANETPMGEAPQLTNLHGLTAQEIVTVQPMTDAGTTILPWQQITTVLNAEDIAVAEQVAARTEEETRPFTPAPNYVPVTFN